MRLLDTNIIIYYFKGVPTVVERMLAAQPSEIVLSSVSVHEIEYGLEKSTAGAERRRQWETFLQNVAIVPFGVEEARVSATIRASLERQGLPIGPYDLLIAATALVSGAVLVTRNLREFERVKGLRTENWY